MIRLINILTVVYSFTASLAIITYPLIEKEEIAELEVDSKRNEKWKNILNNILISVVIIIMIIIIFILRIKCITMLSIFFLFFKECFFFLSLFVSLSSYFPLLFFGFIIPGFSGAVSFCEFLLLTPVPKVRTVIKIINTIIPFVLFIIFTIPILFLLSS